MVRALPPHRSSGAFVAELLPPGTSLVKAFGSIGTDALGTHRLLTSAAASATPGQWG
ncbi:hypothetical protein [Actinocorallia aurea]